HRIGAFQPLLTRVEADKVQAMVEASKESLGAPTPAAAAPGGQAAPQSASTTNSPLSRDPLAPEIEFADFAKVDLRIVKILQAEHVEGADKLLKLTLDLGLNADG